MLLQETCPSPSHLSLWRLHRHECKTPSCSSSSSVLLFSSLCLVSPQGICLLSGRSSCIWSTVLPSSTGFIHQMSVYWHPSHSDLFSFVESSIRVLVSLRCSPWFFQYPDVTCDVDGPTLLPRCTSHQDPSRVSQGSLFVFLMLVVAFLWTVQLSGHGVGQFQQLESCNEFIN